MYYKIVSFVRVDDGDPPCERFSSLADADEALASLMMMHGEECIFTIESIEESVE
jgi:hypothetical protein